MLKSELIDLGYALKINRIGFQQYYRVVGSIGRNDKIYTLRGEIELGKFVCALDNIIISDCLFKLFQT